MARRNYVSDFTRRNPVMKGTGGIKEVTLDYSEDHSGTFGSQRNPSELDRILATVKPPRSSGVDPFNGTAPASSFRASAEQGAFDSLTHRPGTLSPEAQRRILGVKRGTTNMPVPPAAQAPVAQPLAQLAPSPGTIPAKMLADPFGGVNAESRPPQFNTSLGNSDPVFPIAPTPPGRAEVAGQTTRRVLGNVLGAIPKETSFGSSHVTAPAQPDAPILDVPKIASNFFRGFNNPGPAGVTNATAAQFKTPTKENPLPGTDTTPATNIDKSESSLAKFGLSEDELARKKKLAMFGGF
jgi:hypothetical protein